MSSHLCPTTSVSIHFNSFPLHQTRELSVFFTPSHHIAPALIAATPHQKHRLSCGSLTNQHGQGRDRKGLGLLGQDRQQEAEQAWAPCTRCSMVLKPPSRTKRQQDRRKEMAPAAFVELESKNSIARERTADEWEQMLVCIMSRARNDHMQRSSSTWLGAHAGVHHGLCTE